MKLKKLYKSLMSEFRCSFCGKLIFKAKIHGDYHIEAVCTRCKNMNTFERYSERLQK